MVVTKVAFTFKGMKDLVVQLQGTFEGALADALDACGIPEESCKITSTSFPEEKGGQRCSVVIYVTDGMPTQASENIENAIKSEVMKYLPDGAICETVCLPSAITSFQ